VFYDFYICEKLIVGGSFVVGMKVNISQV